MKRISSILIILVLLSLICTNCGGNSPDNTAKKFMQEMAVGNYDEALELVCESSKEEFEEIIRESYEEEPSEEVKKTIEEISGQPYEAGPSETEKQENLEAISKMHFELGEQEGNTAVVHVTREDYPLGYLTIALLKENNEWKVDIPNSSLITAVREASIEKSCYANLRSTVSGTDIYAAVNNGAYPTSWQQLVPEYMEEKPTCPQDGTEYMVEWSVTGPPKITCPNHGTAN